MSQPDLFTQCRELLESAQDLVAHAREARDLLAADYQRPSGWVDCREGDIGAALDNALYDLERKAS